jgi:transposase
LEKVPEMAGQSRWYGAYDFSEGRCLIGHEGKCHGEHTCQFLTRLSDWLTESQRPNQPERPIVMIWDGAPWHRSHSVRAHAQALGMELMALPGYSPDLNPIEGLWKWMRTEVTQLYCHASLHELFQDCLAFIQRINRTPEQVIARLWPKFDLDPDFEKFAFSSSSQFS